MGKKNKHDKCQEANDLALTLQLNAQEGPVPNVGSYQYCRPPSDNSASIRPQNNLNKISLGI